MVRHDKDKKDENTTPDPPKEVPKPDLFVVIDNESNALEYGPSPDVDAAVLHKDKLVASDARGMLADTVGRKLVVYKLEEVKEKKHKDEDE